MSPAVPQSEVAHRIGFFAAHPRLLAGTLIVLNASIWHGHTANGLNLEGRQALDNAIENGRGGIWLELTEDQYRKLKYR